MTNQTPMSKYLWTSLSATVITTLLSSPWPALGLETNEVLTAASENPTTPVVSTPIATEALTEALQETVATPEGAIASPKSAVLDVDAEARQPAALVAYTETAIYSHQAGATTAATLYVNQIPVLTFIGDADAEPASPTWGFLSPEQAREVLTAAHPTVAETHPVFRAAAVAEQIRALRPEQASDIALKWDEADAAYQVYLGEQELFTVDQQQTLPDATQREDEDALQVTNRLRRLVGGAEPIALPNAARRRYRAAINPPVLPGGQQGMASWYGPGFHGRRSASGERFNQNALTAAHRTLPFGTLVRVTNLNNGQSVVVRINDRGPFAHGRVIDLSRQAASEIGMLGSGVAPVQVEVVTE